MLQEIVTCSVVGFAIILAVRLMYKSLAGYKRKKIANADHESFSMQSKCPECTAECTLRDSMAIRNTGKESCIINPSEVKDF